MLDQSKEERTKLMTPPKHIAIIMDGNGRWAMEKGMPRFKGHQEGVKVTKEIVKYCSDIGIPFVTLYVFSTENKKRSSEEVNFLMGLIQKHLRAELKFYVDNNIRVLHIGDLSGLPQAVQEEIITVKEKTKDYKGSSVILAINYGGKDEIVRSIKHLSADEQKNMTEDAFSLCLDTKNVPPVDLVIRTGGEKRLSNFLLWQCAYAELYFSDKYWPSWKKEDLQIAIDDYMARNRRFGLEK
ncbi:MAG: polyprenyl diphosphate synthase [Treponema sp.]